MKPSLSACIRWLPQAVLQLMPFPNDTISGALHFKLETTKQTVALLDLDVNETVTQCQTGPYFKVLTVYNEAMNPWRWWLATVANTVDTLNYRV